MNICLKKKSHVFSMDMFILYIKKKHKWGSFKILLKYNTILEISKANLFSQIAAVKNIIEMLQCCSNKKSHPIHHSSVGGKSIIRNYCFISIGKKCNTSKFKPVMEQQRITCLSL